MRIAITNNLLISANTIEQWFPDTEIQVVRKKECENLKKIEADIVLVDNKTKIEKNGNNPYILAITPEPPVNNIDWVSSESSSNVIQNKLKGVLDYLKLKRKYEELEKKWEEFSELAVIGKVILGVIHELNNPLQVMLGFIEDIEEQISPDSELSKDIHLIKDEIQRCCGILGCVKCLKNKSNEKEFQDVEMVLENVLPLLQYYLRKKRVTVIKKVDPNIYFIRAESNKIHCAFLALLLSVLGSSIEGSKIYVRAQNVDDSVLVEVKFTSDSEYIEPGGCIPIEKYIKSVDAIFTSHIDAPAQHTYVLKFRQIESGTQQVVT